MKRFAAIALSILVLAALFDYASAGSGKLDSSLRFMREIRSGAMRNNESRALLESGAEEERIVVTVKFDHVLTSSEVAEYVSMGADFYYIDGEIARTGAIYPMVAGWADLEEISGRKELLRMEGAWKPAVYPCLDVSAVEIEADSAWGYMDDSGLPITGKGMRVADFDTGIDVFHPSFFFPDGDTLDWIDDNGSGAFESGSDAVDINGNGVADAGEMLRYFDGWIQDYAQVWGSSNPSNVGNGYQTYWDWLYNDSNQNGSRDYGPGAGYTENDPTYGERLFIALDTDENGSLDIGEKVVALGTSKIYATMNADSVERVRGTDLILSDPDLNGHGTGVSGILAGGTPGLHRFTGIAPEAEILMGYFFSDVPISYLVPWARSRGADAMLYEFGAFVWDYLDGSSLDEQIISIESETIIQITPSGNLGRGDKHAIAASPGSGTATLNIGVNTYGGQNPSQIYCTTLWREGLSDISFRLETPLGGEITITGGSQYVDGYYVWSDGSTSSRGTCKLDLYVDKDTNADVYGTWYLKVDNNTAEAVEVVSNVADNLSSWSGGAMFTNYQSDDRNVTWPATADSAFVNGSYSTRGFDGYYGTGGGSIDAGEISAFSGRGVRIDGKHLLDICSPGNYDVYSTKSHQDASGYPLGCYRQFSGTSAAGPHVAAAAALVQQKWPGADMNEIAYLLTSHAASDSYTGSVYNDTWGWGKLRVLAAIGIPTGIEDIEGGETPPVLALGRNYPNPFNPSTWIPFYIPRTGRASLKVYDVRGRLVKTLEDGRISAGSHISRWDGSGLSGKKVSSGIYFCVLKQDGNSQSRKLVLIR